MQRLHVSVASPADQFDASVAFYATLFGREPTKRREGYAKWQIEDPRVNFVVERAGGCHNAPGIHHVGIEAQDAAELEGLRARLRASEAPLLEVGDTVCCYARSDKTWAVDPNGVRWEAFRSTGETDHYGERRAAELDALAASRP